MGISAALAAIQKEAAAFGGYILIVDGMAHSVDTGSRQRLAITPTRAVLHRSGQPSGEKPIIVSLRLCADLLGVTTDGRAPQLKVE